MVETDYCGASGLNYFAEDGLVRRLLEARLPAPDRREALERLTVFGEACGGRLSRLVEDSHQDGRYPRLDRYDRWGKRIDAVVHSAEQVEARRFAMRQGLLPPKPLLERMTMAYLLNQNGEGGITCPLAMTDGLIQLIEGHGTQEQKKRWLPLLNDPDVDTPLTAGQFITEKQGGSNVSENETVAVRAADGTWRLTGLKWFCSNPGELWVTTAKPEGSDKVGLFIVPRRLEDGSLNACEILRLKDLSGTRGKATAEVEYKGAWAQLVSRAAYGMALLFNVVLRASRIHVCAASLGFGRRALLEASLYSKARIVLGAPVAGLSAIADSLRRMEAAQTAATLAFYEELSLIDGESPAAEALIPLLKIGISRMASDQVRRARLILAGNAILRDFSILPRLAEEALIQEIWEGTHDILGGHFLKALRRPASRKAFDGLLASGGQKLPEGTEDLPVEECCGWAYRTLGLALLKREAGGPLDPERAFARFAALLG